MTDRELLELAAKAIGHRIIWYGARSEIIPIDSHGAASGTAWNPLIDDGDAFRLAVKLKFKILPEQASFVSSGTGIHTSENWSDNPCAATRRAIVRAAAEIGKAIKG